GPLGVGHGPVGGGRGGQRGSSSEDGSGGQGEDSEGDQQAAEAAGESGHDRGNLWYGMPTGTTSEDPNRLVVTFVLGSSRTRSPKEPAAADMELQCLLSARRPGSRRRPGPPARSPGRATR